MATFPAFLDTCALFGAYLCDTLLRLAEAGAYQPLWSAGVLEELERNLLERGLPEEAVAYRIREMDGVPFCCPSRVSRRFRAARHLISLNALHKN